MTTTELITALQSLPPDADVWVIAAGAPRIEIHHAYLSKVGDVILADEGEVVYSSANRPADAPDDITERYWATPGRTK